MRTVIRILLVLAATEFAVSLPTPALAKGPQRAMISGPTLEHTVGVGPLTAAQLAESTFLLTSLTPQGCRAVMGCSYRPPGGDLGPRYVIAYRLQMPNEVGHEVRSDLVQYFYPNARPTAVTYIPPGQHVTPWGKTRGTWMLAERDLLFVAGIDLSAPPSVSASVALRCTPRRTP
jgi:hypothetical protein